MAVVVGPCLCASLDCSSRSAGAGWPRLRNITAAIKHNNHRLFRDHNAHVVTALRAPPNVSDTMRARGSVKEAIPAPTHLQADRLCPASWPARAKVEHEWRRNVSPAGAWRPLVLISSSRLLGVPSPARRKAPARPAGPLALQSHWKVRSRGANSRLAPRAAHEKRWDWPGALADRPISSEP